MNNFILYNQILSIKPFEKIYINKKFISFLNNPKVNKYLDVRHKKQTILSAKKYFFLTQEKKIIYSGIFDSKKSNIVGTVTLRKITNKKCYIGNMIGDTSYFGSKISKQSFNMFLCYIFDHLKYTEIHAGTEKNNISANFNIITNGFKLSKKSKLYFFFKLKKNYLKFNTNYKIQYA